MTHATVMQTTLADSGEAGAFLGSAIRRDFKGEAPDAVVLFASARHDYVALLESVTAHCRPPILIGCSSAGEFTTGMQAEGSVSALALRSDSITFSAAIARDLAADTATAAATLSASFRGMQDNSYPYRYALVLADALAGYTDDLIEQLTLLTGGTYQFFGGGAGDDARFQQTHVFYGTEAVSDAVVALEIRSRKPFGIGVRHGWHPVGEMMRVTQAEGVRVGSLNAVPAVEVMKAHAERTGQTFEPEAPVPFFLHNVIGLKSEEGYKLRVPLAVESDGSLLCASDTPQSALASIMATDAPSAGIAAAAATADALSQLNGAEPEVALFFDCVATRLRIGEEFGKELEAVQDVLGGAPLVGCNTYGQIARSEGQFSGFHNCTAVVCVIPE